MSNITGTLANFPNSLEEALEYALEVPFPSLESLVDIEEGFDTSHSPASPCLVESDNEVPILETLDEIINPPLSFLCLEDSSESSGSPSLAMNGSEPNSSHSSLESLCPPGFCSSSSQTPKFPLCHSLDSFRKNYPEVMYPIIFDPPLQSGRAFSLSQLDQMDDQVLQSYRSVDASCVPIPAGFWAEMGRVDTTMNSHFKTLEEFLPNEEWVHRRILEGCPIKITLRRYLKMVLIF